MSSRPVYGKYSWQFSSVRAGRRSYFVCVFIYSPVPAPLPVLQDRPHLPLHKNSNHPPKCTDSNCLSQVFRRKVNLWDGERILHSNGVIAWDKESNDLRVFASEICRWWVRRIHLKVKPSWKALSQRMLYRLWWGILPLHNSNHVGKC